MVRNNKAIHYREKCIHPHTSVTPLSVFDSDNLLEISFMSSLCGEETDFTHLTHVYIYIMHTEVKFYEIRVFEETKK